MRSYAPIILLFIGLFFIYTGVMGNTGVALASVFTPRQVNIKTDTK